MKILRISLVIFFTVISIYTVLAIQADGWNLFAIFFGEIINISWLGQFNLDFALYLTLSAFWLAWRHQFSINGILLAIFNLIGGMMFLTVYLFFISLASKGDMKEILLGKERV